METWGQSLDGKSKWKQWTDIYGRINNTNNKWTASQKTLKPEILEVIQNTLLTLKVPRINCVLRKDQKKIHRFPMQCLCLKENVVVLESVLWIDEIFKSGFVFSL